jgi:hypothetical protein
MKRPMVLVIVAAAVLLTPVLVTGPAQAEVRGMNGQIAFERLAPGGSFDAPGQGTVFVANPDGTHSQQVPLVYPTDSNTAIDWSPDGTRLLLANTIRFDSSGDCCLPFRPATVNPDGSGFKLLTMNWAPFDLYCPVWTIDQRRLLCGTGEDPIGIFSVRASDGGDPRRLTTYPFGPNCNACDEPTDVSPDGTRFVFLRFFRENGPGQQQVAIYVENLDGTGLRQLTPYGYAAPHEVATGPVVPRWDKDHLGDHHGSPLHGAPRWSGTEPDSSTGRERELLRVPCPLVARREQDHLRHVHQRDGGALHREPRRLERGPGHGRSNGLR